MGQVQKKAIVIGASTGIGRGLTKRLIQTGYKVAITARREKLLQEIVAESPDNCIYRAFDITETDALEHHLQDLVQQLNGLDLIIVSAGLAMNSEDLEYENEKYVLNCNVVGFTTIVNWAYRFFKEQGKGHIVGLSSVAGTRGWRSCPKYNASKAFQMNYLEGIRIKSKHEKAHVDITDIRPGYIKTAIMSDEYAFWAVEVPDAIPKMLKAIKKKKRIAYIPYRWRFVAWIYRIFPTILLEKG